MRKKPGQKCDEHKHEDKRLIHVRASENARQKLAAATRLPHYQRTGADAPKASNPAMTRGELE